ncbi:MAG: hypothetical protein FWC19_08890 [Treponema sp.]|nr:hypothetical protein [Treponema sp.]MCL2272897.1 hypothetical protein [Treponema sp.]
MERERLFLKKKAGKKERIETIKWAATNNYNTIVFPLIECYKGLSRDYIKLAKKYDLAIEAGGHELSLLLPRRLFLFHKDLFRMEQGRRKKARHFCPTNHKSTEVISLQTRKLFARSMQILTPPFVFHLFPDEGFENVWCACPACRAFTPAEQNIIAVNSAADVLAKFDPQALLSYLEFGNEPEKPGITPRKNMFMLKNIAMN